MLAMDPEVTDAVFPGELRERLDSLLDIRPTDPVDDFLMPAARSALAQTEVLITGWGCPAVDSAMLAAAPRLAAVFHAAGSVKGHLAAQVWDRGVVVSSAAEANAGPVVEFTLAAITLAGKRAFALARQYTAGQFATRADRSVIGGDGRRVGVIGASRIGRPVIRRLVMAGYRVLVADPYLSSDDAAALGASLTEVDDLCAESDIVTLHAPDVPRTRHLIDERRIALMRGGTIVINTARGALVDTEALTRACASGHLDAVLDVTDPEPLPPGHPLLSLPNVLVTPHLAGASGMEVRRLGGYVLAELTAYLHGQPLRGQIHRDDLPILA